MERLALSTLILLSIYTLDCITELETKQYFTASSAAANMRDGGELKQLTLSLAEVSIALLCTSSSSPCSLRHSCRVIRLAAFTNWHPIWLSIVSSSSSLRARAPLQCRLMRRGCGARAKNSWSSKVQQFLESRIGPIPLMGDSARFYGISLCTDFLMRKKLRVYPQI